ncbi:p-hydroxybenzoic acid efflux pump subunit aaeA [Escherichia coli]|uniref:p-hydroxybenzoic acid efflux pump subunit aaeA n=1 Tax=Escherichia coli TaxID=562 RepID=A0A377BY65_ECOLX|nr:p-hydroxybenzoic acid efflux pump subunit aaeA [Escherichia coli]
MATIDSNLEWVRLAQRVPVRIRLDNQQENIWPGGAPLLQWWSLANKIATKARIRFFRKMAHRLREFG